MSQQQQGNARPKTFLNDYRGLHPTTARPADGAKFPGQLTWEFANNGKIILKADDKLRSEGNAYQKKEMEMDFYNRNTFFEMLLDAANNPDFEKSQFSVMRHGFVRGPNGSQLSENPMKQGELTIMKDKNGVISVGYSKGDYKILFPFDKPGFSEAREFINGEFVPMTGKLSSAFVRGWVNGLRDLLTKIEHENYVPPKPKQNSGGWGGGNNNNNGGGRSNGGGHSGGDIDFDDDIPF